jgi:transcriptional regulator with GAF, ATPase, and Fis domain
VSERPPDAGDRESQLLTMLEAISRSLSGALSVPDAITEITAEAHDLIPFERIAVLTPEAGGLRVHAAAHGIVWSEGRLMERPDCSPRLWPEPMHALRIARADRELDPAYKWDREIIANGTRSILGVPLESRDGPIGMLGFSTPEPDAFDEEHERTASAIAGLVAIALEHERLFRGEVARRSRLAALDAVLPRLAEATDVEAIAAVLGELRTGLLPHDALMIGVIHSADRARLHRVSADGSIDPIDVPVTALQRQFELDGPAGYVVVRDIEILDERERRLRITSLRDGAPQTTEMTLDAALWSLQGSIGLRSMVRVQIHRGETRLGGIVFASQSPGSFDENDLAVARRLAENVSLALAAEKLSTESRRAAEVHARARALESRVDALQRELADARGPHAVVGGSASWRAALAQAARVAAADTTVLLTGESGTGKEVVARFIHRASPRAEGPFVALNCAALPEQLLEAELFGAEKGAYTGATATRIGRVEQAQGGVLFLDEVAEMSPSIQARFLRVLQEREFQRLGGTRVFKADVRVIAATNRDLRAAVARGDFREDLFYRLDVFAIRLEPLRERGEDVLTLAEHFLAELGPDLGVTSPGMTAEARAVMQRYAWPGNVRELRNVIERALILCDGGLIQPGHLALPDVGARAVAEPIAAGAAVASNGGDGGATAASPPADGAIDLEAIERALVERAMKQVAGNKSKAARLLGLTRAQLYSRLER